jgi:tricarballylate dehydrogenase
MPASRRRGEQTADVVVLGAGLAGMSAATSAVERGARVLVIERAPTTGGSAVISGGYVWTANDVPSLRREDPGEFQRHGHIVVECYADAHRWLASFAPPLTDEQPSLHGRGRKYDLPLVILTMTRKICEAGGEIWVDSEVADVGHSGDTYVLSVRRHGDSTVVRTRALILATGGRQADPGARRSLVDGATETPPLRGNAWSRGDGAGIALALGAQLNLANRGFYGHLFARGVEPIAPLDFIAFALYHSEEGVMFDTSGARFADEARGDHNNTMAVAERGGRAVLLWSQDVQERAGGRPFVGGSLPMDRWGISRDRGGRVGAASSTADLASLLRGWGYSVDGTTFDDEYVGARLGAGSVFAADVVPAVTMTFGGVEINSSGNAVTANSETIPGLYAAGGDASDIYHRGYAGGLCAATVIGRRAGADAATYAAGVNASSGMNARVASPR